MNNLPKQQSKQNYLHGAAILTVGVIITKILGAFYKIPLGNILGDEGYAHFMVAYSIFNVFLTLTTAGLPVALSRMISEADTLGRPMQMRRTFRVSLLVFAVIGLVSSLIMFLFPTELAVMMDEVEAAQSIWAISPAIFLVCLAAAYRGYAQGQSNMKPTTVSQVLEVLGKVAVGLVLAWYLTRIGKSLPVASGGAIFGVTAGSLLSLVYMVIYKRRHYPAKAVSDPDVPERAGKIVATLLRIGIPITLGSCVMSLINLVDAKLVLNRLQTAAGVSYFEAKNLYGIYGKAQTLSNLPAAFIVPLTISIIPAITALVVRAEHKEASSLSSASLRVAALVFMPMGVGLAVLAEPIMRVIYPTGNAAGPLLLALLGVGAIVMCLGQMSTAVLQANRLELWPVLGMVLGGVVKIIVNYTLVGNPKIGIYGAPIGTLACYAVMCAANALFLRFRPAEPVRVLPALWRAALSAVIMGAVAWGVYTGLSALLGASWKATALAVAAAVIAAAAVYLAAAVKTRAVTGDDLRLIPHGDKVAKWLHIV